MRQGYYGEETGQERSNPFHTGVYNRNVNKRYRANENPGAHNYNEYYRAHYGNQSARPGTASNGSTRTMNPEDLKSYWDVKDFESNREIKEIQNQQMWRFFIILFLTTAMYLFIYKAKKLEAKRELDYANKNLKN